VIAAYEQARTEAAAARRGRPEKEHGEQPPSSERDASGQPCAASTSQEPSSTDQFGAGL
jgi:hypothetical protein